MKPGSTAPFSNTDEYISAFSADIQTLLSILREAIRQAAPGAEEVISYNMPAFKLNGILVYFAANKHHIGFYPGSPAAVEEFKAELINFKTSKGTIQFSFDKPLPIQLIKKIVKFRLQENKIKEAARIKKNIEKITIL